MRWAEGWALAQELLQDVSSHVYASVREWLYPPSDVERIGLNLFEAWANTQRKRGSLPIVLKRPWEGARSGSQPELVSVDDPERLDAIARLERLTVEGPELPDVTDSPQ